MKWAEYSNDVQFILQRSDAAKSQTNGNEPAKTESKIINSPKKQKSDDWASDKSTNSPILQSNLNSRINQKFDVRKNDLVGVVRGVQHSNKFISPPASPSSSTTTDNTESSVSLPADVKQSLKHISLSMSPILEFNSADIRSSLDRKTSTFREALNLSDDSLHESYKNNNSSIDSQSESYAANPPISSNGALAPPPYRDPPPPQGGHPIHHQKSDSQSSSTNSVGSASFGRASQIELKFMAAEREANHLNAISNLQAIVNNATSDVELMSDSHFQSAQYRDLVQLIKYQREKINMQQADITKYDAEIVYLEDRERDQLQQLDAIARELSKADQLYRQNGEQLQQLQYADEEHELVRQQEKTLKSEITLLRSKLANCETELLQCKNKIRMLMDDIQIEQRSQQYDGRQLEMHLMHEVERIQAEIDGAVHSAESASKGNESLKKDVSQIEGAIADKKKQLEKLVNELKEANLQSLTATSTEEIRHLLEGKQRIRLPKWVNDDFFRFLGSQRPGSTRRIMGSPRQLETAVPTSKNPHGVWV